MKLFALVSLSALASLGCASTTPPELLSARTAYTSASSGPAAQRNPAGLKAAKEALDAAEAFFSEHGASEETVDLAYAAERRVRIAEADARTAQVNADSERAIAALRAGQASQAQVTSAELARTKAQVDSEQKLREEAARNAQMAMMGLADVAPVTQEPRGAVITLAAAVLFEGAKTGLLPRAKGRLDRIADALLKQDPQATILVEGHSDSQGAPKRNQDLSQQRAEAVRDYLVVRGIPADRISAQGFGPNRPVEENVTAEGRARNRRVEIVVKPKE